MFLNNIMYIVILILLFVVSFIFYKEYILIKLGIIDSKINIINMNIVTCFYNINELIPEVHNDYLLLSNALEDNSCSIENNPYSYLLELIEYLNSRLDKKTIINTDFHVNILDKLLLLQVEYEEYEKLLKEKDKIVNNFFSNYFYKNSEYCINNTLNIVKLTQHFTMEK